jgi:hypothetical protein
MSELYDGSDWGDTSGISNTQSDDGYNYWTDPSVSNLDANTGLSQSYNGEDWGDITDAILNGEVNPTPSSSLTPNSSTLASPNLFSQLFSGV